MTLRIGTLCFLLSGRTIVDPPSTRLPPGLLSESAGRIVEAIGAPFAHYLAAETYPISAPWLPPRGRFSASRRVLIPLSEPPDELPAPPQHEPLTA